MAGVQGFEPMTQRVKVAYATVTSYPNKNLRTGLDTGWGEFSPDTRN